MKKHSIIALVLMGVISLGCVKEEIHDQVGGSVSLTTTVCLGGEPGSKALTAAGVKTFAVDDQIAVIYKNTGGETVKAVSSALVAEDIVGDGKMAIITVTLTNPAQNGALRYIYPAAMAKDDGSVNYDALNAQDGTLASLASGLDLAVYDGNLTGEATLPASVTLTNPLTIGEFNIKNGGNDITAGITMMTVFDGANAYIVNRAAGAGPIYVAMQPVSSDRTLQFCATDGTTSYRKHVTGKTIAAGNMYPVNLTMPTETRTCLELLTAHHTIQDGETLTGVLLGKYKISTSTGQNDAPVTVTLDGVDINSTLPDKAVSAGLICEGNTILQLTDGSDNKVKGAAGWAGVYIKKERTLTIRGNGSLTAIGTYGSTYFGAGIGGYGKGCGSIVIESGTIEARGSSNSAGIGTGSTTISSTAGSTITGGNITITGGTVTAIGGTNGAGIGTGYARQYKDGKHYLPINNQCGNILISGGTVVATGGSCAAGIGCGRIYASGNPSGIIKSSSGYVDNQCGSITITATVIRVTATKGDDAPNSIGKGQIGDDHYGFQICGTITIGGEDKGTDGVNPASGDTYVYQP